MPLVDIYKLIIFAMLAIIGFIAFVRMDMRRDALKAGQKSIKYINQQFRMAVEGRRVVEEITKGENNATLKFLAMLIQSSINPPSKNDLRVGYIHNFWVGTMFVSPHDEHLTRACDLFMELFYKTYGAYIETPNGALPNHCRVVIVHADQIDEFNRCKREHTPFTSCASDLRPTEWHNGCTIAMEYLINTPDLHTLPQPRLMLF